MKKKKENIRKEKVRRKGSWEGTDEKWQVLESSDKGRKNRITHSKHSNSEKELSITGSCHKNIYRRENRDVCVHWAEKNKMRKGRMKTSNPGIQNRRGRVGQGVAPPSIYATSHRITTAAT